MIKLEHVDKYFGDLHVLKDVNLEVAEGEKLVIIGPSGSGKSTTVRCMNFLEEPTSGHVYINGEELTNKNKTRVVRENISMVFQQFNLFNNMTVFDNCMAGVHKVKKRSKEYSTEICMKYLEKVGMPPYVKAKPHQLSGGMKQRVGIARAYASESDILLLDEPFGALDAQTRYQMEDEIIKIWEKNKKTIIFVTNNVEEALYLGDRILLLSSRPAEIKKEYVVDLPRPRSYTDKAFLEYRNEIVDNTDLDI